MFDSLRKKLKESVQKLTRKVSAPKPEKKPKEKPRPKVAKPKAKPKPLEKKPIEKPTEKPVEKPEEPIEEPQETKPLEPVEEPVKEPIEEPLEEPAPPEPLEEPREVAEEPKPPEPIEEVKEEPKEKRGFFHRIRERVTERALSESDIDSLFDESETELLQANVALEVIDFLKKDLKEKLAGRNVKRSQAGEFISKAFNEALLETVNQGRVDLVKMVKKKKPLTCVFLGFNGSGKTTSIAKIAKYLQGKGLKPLLAAGDTFRAAAQEQLEHHGGKLKLKVIKHQYGADSAAVIFDAIRHAEGQGYDVVLADTAGRTHVDKNLADELKKVVRVNKPDLKILVVDSLTGNDAVEQARDFNEMVGVDAVIMTKVDVNKKGGSILSVCYAIKKPILFIGMGQGYEDLEAFSPAKFVKQILS